MECVIARTLRFAGLMLVASALTGCLSAPVLIEYTTSGYLVTSTGERLYRVRATELGALYLKLGVDFADYGEVAFRGATLEYDGVPLTPSFLNQKPGNFQLSLDAFDRILREVGEGLADGVERAEGLRVVSEPTAQGLVISPHLVRFRWETPPAQGGESLFVRRTGYAALILDVRNSQGELLARIADAREIKPLDVGLQGAFESSPANNWAGVRDISTRWGWLLRGALEALRGMPPLEPGDLAGTDL